MEFPKKQKNRVSTVLAVAIAASMLSIGFLAGYWASYNLNLETINRLQERLITVEEEIDELKAAEAVYLNQSALSAKISALQNQISAINNQIDSLQSSFGDGLNQNEINTKIDNLQSQVSSLKNLVDEVKAAVDYSYENVTVYLGETALSDLFEQVRDSVVTVQASIREYDIFGRPILTSVQGSGFVNNFNDQMIILTCNHVVEDAASMSVTFSNGNTYTASLKGTDPETDLAVLTTNAPQNEYKPLLIVSSSTLKVGEPVIVVGTPYGLEGSMSTGIVSSTNRTITVDQTIITDIIQTTAPLNPGNSGGPLMNYRGHVVGMATAIVQESEGIGLAIPSDTIQQDINVIMAQD